MKSLLEKLNIKEVNAGGCTGPGNWYKDDKATPLTSYNPTNGEPIAKVAQVGDEAYEKIMSKSTEAFKTWRMMPAPKRGEVIRDLGVALREVKEPLGELVTLEMGKIKVEGMGEVQEMIDICDFAVGLSRQLYGLTMHSERPGHRMYEQWHPMGPIAIVTAFNFPVAVWAWNSAIAGVCGDTMIWKPSSEAMLTAVAVQHIANKVAADYQLDGIFNLCIGPGRTIGDKLIHDPRIQLVSFTGSTKMGHRVAEATAKRFAGTILELGGNNAIIVAEDANMDMAVRAILFGAVGTAGQRCTTTRRIIMHKSIAKELTERLVRAYKQVKIGDPLDDGTLMGPLVTEAAVEDMMAALNQVRAQGGEVLCGGNKLPDMGKKFVEPTIVKMPKQTDIVREETFAPILYLLEYESIDEAIEIHNDVPQGLSSAVFTTNLLTAEKFLSHRGSDCGIANVNIGTSGAEIGGAFGGEKDTGGGRESGSDAWKGYMRRQTNTINWSTELPLAQGITFGD
ncbi:MAG: aldehyde dehydrogenase family protein [candidate division KSB1 bacterium]|jgi:aldehyde dehydrogenase (NAD+)|nr:aldehyde dehydrogenase family protein [candidate division KSB1 bacterium]